MLRHLLSLTLFSFALLACDAETDANEIPANIRTAFSSAYPGVDDVEWEQNADGTYDVEFEMDGEEMEVRYDANGQVLELEAD